MAEETNHIPIEEKARLREAGYRSLWVVGEPFKGHEVHRTVKLDVVDHFMKHLVVSQEMARLVFGWLTNAALIVKLQQVGSQMYIKLLQEPDAYFRKAKEASTARAVAAPEEKAGTSVERAYKFLYRVVAVRKEGVLVAFEPTTRLCNKFRSLSTRAANELLEKMKADGSTKPATIKGAQSSTIELLRVLDTNDEAVQTPTETEAQAIVDERVLYYFGRLWSKFGPHITAPVVIERPLSILQMSNGRAGLSEEEARLAMQKLAERNLLTYPEQLHTATLLVRPEDIGKPVCETPAIDVPPPRRIIIDAPRISTPPPCIETLVELSSDIVAAAPIEATAAPMPEELVHTPALAVELSSTPAPPAELSSALPVHPVELSSTPTPPAELSSESVAKELPPLEITSKATRPPAAKVAPRVSQEAHHALRVLWVLKSPVKKSENDLPVVFIPYACVSNKLGISKADVQKLFDELVTAEAIQLAVRMRTNGMPETYVEILLTAEEVVVDPSISSGVTIHKEELVRGGLITDDEDQSDETPTATTASHATSDDLPPARVVSGASELTQEDLRRALVALWAARSPTQMSTSGHPLVYQAWSPSVRETLGVAKKSDVDPFLDALVNVRAIQRLERTQANGKVLHLIELLKSPEDFGGTPSKRATTIPPPPVPAKVAPAPIETKSSTDVVSEKALRALDALWKASEVVGGQHVAKKISQCITSALGITDDEVEGICIELVNAHAVRWREWRVGTGTGAYLVLLLQSKDIAPARTVDTGAAKQVPVAAAPIKEPKVPKQVATSSPTLNVSLRALQALDVLWKNAMHINEGLRDYTVVSHPQQRLTEQMGFSGETADQLIVELIMAGAAWWDPSHVVDPAVEDEVLRLELTKEQLVNRKLESMGGTPLPAPTPAAKPEVRKEPLVTPQARTLSVPPQPPVMQAVTPKAVPSTATGDADSATREVQKLIAQHRDGATTIDGKIQRLQTALEILQQEDAPAALVAVETKVGKLVEQSDAINKKIQRLQMALEILEQED